RGDHPEAVMTKILLVDDNEDNRNGLARRLRRRGYEVVLACDGRQGVEQARSAAPDLVLMDINLPEIDGWEATRLIRAADQTSSIPVIALTCPYCGVGCTLTLHVQDNRIVKVTSPLDVDVTHGQLCIKGRFGFEHVHLRADSTEDSNEK